MDDTFTDAMRPHLPFLPVERELEQHDALADLGLNSMQAVELLFAIEDAYGVVIPDDKLDEETFATAGNLWKAVQEARGSDRDAP